MFKVSYSLVNARLKTLVKILNSACIWLLRKVVPGFLRSASKYDI